MGWLGAKATEGAVVVGLLYDKIPMGRRNRGLVGIAVTSVFIIAAYAWGLSYQVKFTRSTELVKMHWSSPGFGQPISILVLCECLSFGILLQTNQPKTTLETLFIKEQRKPAFSFVRC